MLECAFYSSGEWFHVAGTYDAVIGKAKIYVNGELKNMTTGDGLLSIDWLRKAGIGDHKALRPLMGSISDFRIYNYALPGAEIKKLVDGCKGYRRKYISALNEPNRCMHVQ